MPRNNRFYAWIVATSPLYRYLLSIGGCCLIATTWFFTLYGWVETCIHHERAGVAQLHQRCVQAVAGEGQCPILEDSIEQLRIKRDKKRAAHCSGRTAQECISGILQQARSCHLTLCSFNASQAKVGAQSEVQFQFSGHMRDAISLFRTLFSTYGTRLAYQRMQFTSQFNDQWNMSCSLRLAV